MLGCATARVLIELCTKSSGCCSAAVAIR